MSKSVRWSTVTVYEFGVGIGGSAVPRRGGPAVGLQGAPQSVWSTSIDVAQQVQEPQTERRSRRHRRRVRWLKPLERITMLQKAGYSEDRIYRMLMESSSIAQSRRLCLLATPLECTSTVA